MKAANLGGGPRGWLMVVIAAIMLVAGALFLGGCGGDEEKAAAESEEDVQAVSVKQEDIRDITEVGDGSEEIITGYTENQCIAEMTLRYGSAETAGEVCNTIRTDYSASGEVEQLPQIVPEVEQKLGVTPLPGAPAPGSSTPNPDPGNPADPGNPPANQPGSPVVDPGSGWDSGGIEITVPPPPN